MEKPSKQKYHPNSLIQESWRLDLTGTHHLLPDHGPVRQITRRPKSLIMGWENGNKLVTTHFPMVTSMYRILVYKNLHKLIIMKNNVILYRLYNIAVRYIFYFNKKNSFHFRISWYATASTTESVLIIGGFTNDSPSHSSTIAEYRNGSWKIVWNLAQARYDHGAITSGSITMVVGGRKHGGVS